MIRTTFAFLAALVLAAVPARGQTDMDRVLPVDPQIRMGQLENGLTYYIRENHKPENRAELRLVVNAGSILEKDDQQGLAHFLEHMAFNGTEHFKANELVSFLESIGAKFGADLNAYTSFDETVYMLEIPTDKPGLLEKGVMVLGDWAHTITNSPEEVHKERGVVLEEWRRGQGAQERLRRIHWPVLLAGSRYAERLPIGKPEIIENAEPAPIQAFYQRWYRPDLMAVVAVGAFDADSLEAMIRGNFGHIPTPDTPADRPTYPVPLGDAVRASAATDPEMPYTQVVAYYKHPITPQGTVGAYRRTLVESLLSAMFNARLSEITEKPGAPFKVAFAGGGSAFRTVDMYQVLAFTDQGQAVPALSAVLTEVARIRGHGFQPGELERAKADFLAGMENAYNERDKTESAGYAGEYIRNFLEQEPIPGIEAEFSLVKDLMAGITLDDEEAAVDRIFQDTNLVVTDSEPAKEGVTPATPDELLAATKEAETAAPAAYEDKTSGTALLETEPTPGTVVSREEKPDLGVTVLTLSNGVEVWLKPTDFKNDEILFSATAKGGLSLADPKDYASARLSAALVQEAGLGSFTPSDLEKLLSGKIASVSPSISTFTEAVRGQTTPKDLETALQLVYLTFTDPNPRPEAFDVLKDRYKAFIENRTSRPETQFQDRVQEITLSDHPLFQPPTLAWLDRADPKVAMDFYRKRFADASDFRFFFVGALDVDTMADLAARYLGSLPSDPGTPAAYKDLDLHFPDGVVRERVYAGTEPKSQTRITWPAVTGLGEMEIFALNKADDILEIRLRDALREELGGTYSVGVGYNPWIPYRRYGTTSVGYGSSPENADPLLKRVMDEIARFQAEGPTDEEVAKIKELERRSLEKGLEQNGYWLGSFSTLDLLGWDPARILERKERIEALSGKAMQEAVVKYFPADHYAAVTLLPENLKPAEDTGAK